MSAEPKAIHEPARDVPVRDRVDVLVAGGGLGGCSAATSAARMGARTLLVERNGFLGGVATAGMCCSIFNCFYTSGHCLGITGNAVEVADAFAEAEGYGVKWHQHKGHVIYDVEEAKRVLFDLADGAGAEVLLDTLVSDVVMEGERVRGVIVESKSGREAILADAVVDATGDADVAARAGVALNATREKGLHSFCFRMGGVDVDEFVRYFAEHPNQYPERMDVDWTLGEALAQYRDTGTLLFPHGGAMQMEIFQRARAEGRYPERIGMHDTLDACQMHALRERGVVHVITGFVHFPDLDIGKISRAIHDGRRMAFAVSEFFRGNVPGFGRAFVVATADDLGIRVSRWLDGEFVFTREMKENATRFEDAVGRGVAEVDLTKHPGRKAWGVQTFGDDTFDVPYRCMLPRRVEGLVMGAGRSLSCDPPFLLRVMALTMVVGQAAGTAADVAAREGSTPRAVRVSTIQDALKEQGVRLD